MIKIKNGKIPLLLKVLYTAFMSVLIPVYWYNYGPTNFLYFCDVAIILTLVGIWLESSLIVSMCAVGILVPQTLWVVDFVGNIFGHPVTNMTAYMFQADHSLFLRGLSFFHGWIPFLLTYLVWKLGYDKKALPGWTGLAWALMLICYFFMPEPNPNAGLTPVNINYVYGMSDDKAQTWMPAPMWLLSLMVGLPIVFYFPVHWILKKFFSGTRA